MYRSPGAVFAATFLLVISTVVPAPGQDTKAVKAFFEGFKNAPLRLIGPADSALADYRKLEQIVLLRHGEPALTRNRWVNRDEFKAYIHAYDTVGVHPFEKLPLEKDTLLNRVFTSRLPRAIHSASLVFGPDITFVPNAQFNEFHRKAMAFPNIALPFGFWSGFGRFLWILGFNDGGIESFADARFRAFYNALRLEDEAAIHGRAVLVAHGFMHTYIANYLKKRGWTVVNLDGKKYYGRYVAYRFR